jgi:hypothetical protein
LLTRWWHAVEDGSADTTLKIMLAVKKLNLYKNREAMTMASMKATIPMMRD